MARRLLTRAELRMEDLQEYELVKKFQEKRKAGMEPLNIPNALGRHDDSIASNFKHNREMIYERIGYNPNPRNPQ